VWAYDIFYEFDLLGAVLSEEVCMGFEGGEVVFSRSALVGAESNACLVQFRESLGYGLDTCVIEYLVGRRIQGDVDVDSEKDPLISRFNIVKR
jgi:hypothetical protein